jgi:heptosyltransferase-1
LGSHYLIVKTSSLGDVIHAMPALTEWRSHRPEARFDWVVEEAYAPLVRLNEGVDTVIPVAWRRWRRHLGERATWREIGALRSHLRSRDYTGVIDAQGLLKSALIARLASRPITGLDRASAREPLASLLYAQRIRVPWGQHAVDRCRQLMAAAGGYACAPPLPDCGLRVTPSRDDSERPLCVLLHGTAGAAKQWPESAWRTVAEALIARGLRVDLPHGNDEELARARRIAEGLAHARVPERRPLDLMAAHLAGACLVIGVDTGLLHLAAALEVPLVGLYVNTAPEATGPVGRGPMIVLGSPGHSPQPTEVLAALDTLPLANAAGSGTTDRTPD